MIVNWVVLLRTNLVQSSGKLLFLLVFTTLPKVFSLLVLPPCLIPSCYSGNIPSFPLRLDLIFIPFLSRSFYLFHKTPVLKIKRSIPVLVVAFVILILCIHPFPSFLPQPVTPSSEGRLSPSSLPPSQSLYLSLRGSRLSRRRSSEDPSTISSTRRPLQLSGSPC